MKHSSGRLLIGLGLVGYVDLAVLGIDPNADGMICIIEESRAPGKALCEPFKISPASAIGGQFRDNRVGLT